MGSQGTYCVVVDWLSLLMRSSLCQWTESQKAGILGILDTENIFQINQIEEHSATITGNILRFIKNHG